MITISGRLNLQTQAVNHSELGRDDLDFPPITNNILLECIILLPSLKQLIKLYILLCFLDIYDSVESIKHTVQPRIYQTPSQSRGMYNLI